MKTDLVHCGGNRWVGNAFPGTRHGTEDAACVSIVSPATTTPVNESDVLTFTQAN